MPVSLITHERKACWARRLRPLMSEWNIRLVETRTTEQLASVAARSACPVVIIDLGSRWEGALDGVVAARGSAPNGLVLTLLGTDQLELTPVFRDAGATLVLSVNLPIPRVFAPVRGWIEIARKRLDRDGWALDRNPEPDPWEAMLHDASKPIANS